MSPPFSLSILHLSDLHFGRQHRFEREGLSSLLSRIKDDLHERTVRFGLKSDLVVLSGDFAEYGSRTPEALKAELAKLVQRLGA